jgi:hypothetical protein
MLIISQGQFVFAHFILMSEMHADGDVIAALERLRDRADLLFRLVGEEENVIKKISRGVIRWIERMSIQDIKHCALRPAELSVVGGMEEMIHGLPVPRIQMGSLYFREGAVE